MPNMADIVVKKADNVTNVTYVAQSGSAGDKSPAIWTQNAFSGIAGFRPKLEILTQDNGQKTIRQLKVNFTFPSTYTDTNTGLVKANGSVGFDGVVFLPKGLTTTEWNEAFAQLGNLLASTLVREVAQTGYAPV